MRLTGDIAIIGAGKIAYSITAALFKAGITPSIIVSRNIRSAEELAFTFSVPLFSNQLRAVSKNIRTIFISTPDNQISPTARALSKLKMPFSRQLFIHLSGALSLDILSPLQKAGAMTASLHIMHTFPNKIPQNIEGMPAAVEYCSENALKRVNNICKVLALSPFYLNRKQKTLYHLAGVFAANFLVGNLNITRQIISTAGIDHRLFEQVFIKISESTLANIRKNGINSALSGPVERNDLVTVKKHIKELKKLRGQNSFQILINYLISSLIICNVAAAKNPSIDYSPLKIFLENEIKMGKSKPENYEITLSDHPLS